MYLQNARREEETGGPLLGDGWKDTSPGNRCRVEKQPHLALSFFLKHNRRGCEMVQQVKVLSRDPHTVEGENNWKKSCPLAYSHIFWHALFVSTNK